MKICQKLMLVFCVG